MKIKYYMKIVKINKSVMKTNYLKCTTDWK